MSVITKDLGIATAYGYAKSKGYTGTEEEFAELMASYADVAQQAEAAAQDAEDAKDAAITAKTAAQTAQTAAESAQTAATGSAQTASTKATEASNSAQSAAGSASAAQASATAVSGSAQMAQTAAQTATTKASEASSSASAASTAKTGAQTAQTAAETAQANAEAAASSVSASAAQIDQNTEDITGLKNDLIQLENAGITRSMLSDTYQSDQTNILTSTDDLDSCLVPNVYRAGVGTLHAPTNNMNYHVIVFESKWQNSTRKAITQIAISAANSQKLYVRTAVTNSSGVPSWDNSGNWTPINFELSNIGNNTITRSMLSNFYEGHLGYMPSGSDLNTVTTACNVLINAGVSNSPNSVYRWLVFSQAVPWTTDNSSRYSLIQRAYRIDMPSEQYYRVYDSGLTVKWSSWESLTEHIKAASDPVGLTGKKIVLMGDSTYAITGSTGNHVANYIMQIGSCTVYDCSFGGTRMSDCRDEQAGGTSSDTYKYFDFPRLVDAIIAGDFSDQDANLSGKAQEYATNLATLKTVDFSEIDYLCIEYGANDFTGNVPLGTNASDKTTVKGALIYCVNALMTEYPNLVILVDGMRYRAWLDGSNQFVDDVFTHKNTLDLATSDYISAIREQSGLFGLPFFDNLTHYGWNKYNRSVYFPANDGAHFNLAGVKYAAKALGAHISSIGKSQSL